jgi:hypothetical protein
VSSNRRGHVPRKRVSTAKDSMRAILLVPLLLLLLPAAVRGQTIRLSNGQMFSGSFTDFTTPVDDLQVIANFGDGTVHRYPAVQLWGDTQFQPAPFVTAPLRFAGCSNGWNKGSFTPTDIDGCSASCPPGCPTSCGWNNMNNSIAVVLRSNCYFSDKSRNAAANGAVGILIVDNIVEDTAHMGFAHVGPALSIPTVIIGNSAGLSIASDILKSNSTTIGSILDSDEHSLKINVDQAFSTPTGSAFLGSVEFRLTANSDTIMPFALSYGKFPVTGTVDKQNNVKISPSGSWTYQPNAAVFQAQPFSLQGVLSTVTIGSYSNYKVITGGIVGYDGISSYFSTREHSASCFPELSFADVCQSAKRLFLCGGSNQTQVCAVATDSAGFRIFNDNTACPWGEPMLWYSTLDGPLEGQHVTLASVSETAGCRSGQRYAHPFITDWRSSLSDIAKQYTGQGVTLANGTSAYNDPTKPCGDTTDPGVVLAGGYLSFGPISVSAAANRCNRTFTMTATLKDYGYLAFSHQSFGNYQCNYYPYLCVDL